MRLVFAGTPAVAVTSLRALLASRHTVAAVVTRPDAPAGRGRKVEPSPVAALAREHGLEVLAPARPREPQFLDRLRQIAPDCCPVTAYGALLPQEALDIPRFGWVNLHFSLLPAWRGAAPVQHAVLHGDDITGATTFRIVAELDAGPLFGVVTEPIRPTDTSGDLLGRLAESGAGLLVATLDGIEDAAIRAEPQPAEGVSFAPKLAPADARVDWKLPAHLINRAIRACTPDPGAWTEFDQARIRIFPVTSPAPSSASPPRARRASRQPRRCACRDRLATGTARGCPAPGQAPHAGRRLGARAARERRGRVPARVQLMPGDRPRVPARRRVMGPQHADNSKGREAQQPDRGADLTDNSKEREARQAGSPRKPGGSRQAAESRQPSGARQPSRARGGSGQRFRVDPARLAAFDVLDAVDSREAYANLLLPRLLADRGITGRDAALATELAYGTLRGQGTYDAVLAACSDRPLGKLDPPVLLALRIGAHQLLATRVGSHAAVATSVDLAKDVAGPRSSGYVNAVLRRVATRDLHEWLPIVAPSPDADRDGYLSVRYSYPRWIVAAYRAALRADPGPADPGPADPGPAELEAALAAGNERPRVTMAVTPGAVDREAIMPAGAEPARWSPYGFTLPGGDPARLVAGGHMVVQDEASQLAALLLARAPVAEASGDAAAPVWLDMCAGPGGKARMLHGLATLGGARVVAAEVHPHRARLVASALASWPISSAPPALSPSSPVAGAQAGTPDSSGEQEKEIAARVVVADGRRPAWRDGAFDRVLVDVPCTGLGALRRRPEARWRKSPADLRQLGDLQRALLKSALAAVRPGGVVAYVTCSPVPAETSEVVAGAVADAPGVQILNAPDLLPEVPGLRAAADGRYAQFWPHRHGTDAIFIALLRRLV